MKNFGTRYPTVFEINTWVWLAELGRAGGRAVTLGAVPQDEIERIAGYGFDAVWLMGVWERSHAARAVSRSHAGWLDEYRRLLPDLEERDIVGSPYAIRAYRVEPSFGGDEELRALRRRFADAGMRLILDFIPNHMALDHPWFATHPERLLQGGEEQIARQPQNYFRAAGDGAGRAFAHGRDPYFDGWPDTVQLDYRRRDTREAMTAELLSVAERCDGARCDMAMLLTHDVFLRTWGGEFDEPGVEFWPAAVAGIKSRHPEFVLLAEVYWDMEYELQRQGFDYTYDKRLYDRLRDADAQAVNAHLRAEMGFQERLVRFVENHDEPRAAEAFPAPSGFAASAVTLALPGLRLLHEGQLEGRRHKLSVHLGRRPDEETDSRLAGHYRRLLAALRHEVFHEGRWRLLEAREAGQGDASFHNFVASLWESGEELRLVVANLSPDGARCRLPLGVDALAGREWFLTDLLGEARYLRAGDDLLRPGLYLDVPGHGCHLFEITPG
ncbi:MAG TPA: alpha-amylase family glycosyl hydrolase [Pyrinomonadaceae bacterium]|nr:alpha-amylase family glycosyl hydrolase [Pyrinomonadaceae bacterium]